MISTRRIVAAVGLAASVTGLAAPSVNASEADARSAGRLGPVALLDSLTVSDIPAEHREEIPRPSAQLAGLKRLNDLNQLRQVTDMAAPLTGLLPAVR
ncbi:hypothetical protein [Streptomyces chromofuscus]|uniref:Secreted protein n=1 Tax=Streptomyces chromofuscus TaxID=42881 RepID=A0A7M2T917_STRCW|nr:hypothetical protein [Streptomyces chromofuscus]QOV44435.1 hypothetical protein IPT68_33300 [Streptomyces chromofuscus]GGT22589.1 hypothetical protein GCM10010254_48730 [Streptomyces chromofuscus]